MRAHGDDKPPRVAWGLYKRFAIAAVLIFVLTTGAVASAVMLKEDSLISAFTDNATPIPGIDPELAGTDAGEPQTILVLGSDRRAKTAVDASEQGLSDSMMLIRLDPDASTISAMSFPRDLQVRIPASKRTRRYPGNAEYTGKLNEAYAYGGAVLTLRTIKRLLGPRVPINHVINVGFDGFQRLVNKVGCVYLDIDKRYFNDNSGGDQYAVIDIQPGYQRLCGSDALSYVRYRHGDDTFVRDARQQDFVRQFKAQNSASSLFGDSEELIKIMAEHSQSDLAHNKGEAKQFLRLLVGTLDQPLREVRFRAQSVPGRVTISDEALETTINQFLYPAKRPKKKAESASATEGAKSSGSSSRKRAESEREQLPSGIIEAITQGEDEVTAIASKATFPVYFPGAILGRGGYVQDSFTVENPRLYKISDRTGRERWPAYRIVLSQGDVGQHYGVQGTTWRNPPILKDAKDLERMAGRTYRIMYDGTRIRLIAWKTDRATYWVSNTLSNKLTNAQMRAIAKSLRRVGEK